eukprot:IDg8163t1
MDRARRFCEIPEIYTFPQFALCNVQPYAPLLACLSLLGSRRGRYLLQWAVSTFHCYAALLLALQLLFKMHDTPFERFWSKGQMTGTEC